MLLLWSFRTDALARSSFILCDCKAETYESTVSRTKILDPCQIYVCYVTVMYIRPGMLTVQRTRNNITFELTSSGVRSMEAESVPQKCISKRSNCNGGAPH